MKLKVSSSGELATGASASWVEQHTYRPCAVSQTLLSDSTPLGGETLFSKLLSRGSVGLSLSDGREEMLAAISNLK